MAHILTGLCFLCLLLLQRMVNSCLRLLRLLIYNFLFFKASSTFGPTVEVAAHLRCSRAAPLVDTSARSLLTLPLVNPGMQGARGCAQVHVHLEGLLGHDEFKF
jgi:hypothetical protein